MALGALSPWFFTISVGSVLLEEMAIHRYTGWRVLAIQFGRGYGRFAFAAKRFSRTSNRRERARSTDWTAVFEVAGSGIGADEGGVIANAVRPELAFNVFCCRGPEGATAISACVSRPDWL